MRQKSPLGFRDSDRKDRSMSRIGGRHRSMVRPERSRSRTTGHHGVSRSRTREIGFREHDFIETGADGREEVKWYSWWPLLTRLLTFWIPSWTLSKCGGMHDERIQAAWREKVALCLIVTIMCLGLAFLTFGLTIIVCRPRSKPVYSIKMVEERDVTDTERWFLIHGMIYNIPESYKPYVHKNFNPYDEFATMDVSPYFPWTPDCIWAGVRGRLKCRAPGSNIEHCHDPLILNYMEYIADVAYDWEDIDGTTRMVYNGEVMDVGPYLDQVSESDPLQQIFGSQVDRIIRHNLGGDATKAMSTLSSEMRSCLMQNFRTGFLEVKTIGCIVTDIVLYVSLVAILSLVFAKFILAVAFAFIMARRLGRPHSKGYQNPSGTDSQRRRKISRSASATLRLSQFSAGFKDDDAGDSNLLESPMLEINKTKTFLHQSLVGDEAFVVESSKKIIRHDSTTSPNHMYTVLLVTCYSEGEAGLRTTLDSLTETSYDDSQKLLFVIADGIVTGAGNEKSTPDTVISMIELAHDRFDGFSFDEMGRPELLSYVAIVDGVKRHNMARVYAGFYSSKEHRVPIILVVKCGGPAEAEAAKPGNRGKRDSQIILMSFFSKVLFDDRMTPLEYDIFYKIYRLTGIMPDQYEAVLMVDADTKVHSNALSKLTCALRHDALIMGLCGETRIANKCSSWVSMIQVFEYFISHHMNKAFESVFGGVTCLPGCFCMYRIKAPKDDGWIPILASPDIVDTYSECQTDTLHKKNLLLLGEDRYLTTLMLKTFPKRKLLFVPQAVCETIVPDEFSVLLSQRRRWINSTIHNLFELVLVPDLCGTFCCSMQFVVFMELIGTLVLPAAIIFTIVMLVTTFVGEPQWIPLFLLLAILGLPALLIFFTTWDVTYFFWFVVYLLALPIWNFVLPVYSFWHFDDFSWGQTRKLDGPADGSKKKLDDDHGKAEGRFDYSTIFMKRWHDFEVERLAKSERWRAAGGLPGVNSYATVRHTAANDYEFSVADGGSRFNAVHFKDDAIVRSKKTGDDQVDKKEFESTVNPSEGERGAKFFEDGVVNKSNPRRPSHRPPPPPKSVNQEKFSSPIDESSPPPPPPPPRRPSQK